MSSSRAQKRAQKPSVETRVLALLDKVAEHLGSFPTSEESKAKNDGNLDLAYTIKAAYAQKLESLKHDFVALAQERARKRGLTT